MRYAAVTALLALLSLGGSPAGAQEEIPSLRELTIGFLSLDDDPRYAEEFVYARIEIRPTGDAVDGARLGLLDTEMISEASGFSVSLVQESAPDVEGLVADVTAMAEAGTQFVVLDLPGDAVAGLAEQTQGLGVTLINATAPEDGLRLACLPNVLHTSASDRMYSDALVQYLRAQNWTRVLVLVGEEPRDQLIADSFISSAERQRIDIVDTRAFVLAADPANREENNTALVTGGVEYDVVFLADSRGEFGRYLPYATQLPRPVIGSTGLVATEWHWSLERYGAPQVNSRFEDLSGGRRMAGQDFNTWMAVKTIVSAYARSRSEDPAEIEAYLRSDRLRVDGSKGVQMNFRPWSGQLRQPIMLATHNAVIAIPPLDGFLHQTNTLDTLGFDEPELSCN